MTDLATERQIRAASPGQSTWLSANAGSGKTKVLTDRVARLLLNGTEPQKVLCLTYTKAAAGEMQNRLLKRLGAWAMLPDAELRAELTRLGEGDMADRDDISPDRLRQARRLFAQAIEAPGGLKIQTIHSFCGALLRRFPLEAGVPHGFGELDERTATDMRQAIVEDIASGPDRGVLDDLVLLYSGEDLSGLIAAIGSQADAFATAPERGDILAALGLPADFDRADLTQVAFDGSEKQLLDQVIPILKGQSATMKTLAAKLATLNLTAPGRTDLDLLYAELLKKADGTPKSASIPTKVAQREMGEDLSEEFHAFMDRVADARNAEAALLLADRSIALARFAAVFLPLYRARKARGGWLDFDDLIERAGALLSSPSVAQWVLFRLDGGIDHILVDEAQDTSPGQWRVIERLADEFTAGEGARDEARTIFVVGDRKQSIYSFQGADLARFEAMKAHFEQKFAVIGRPLQVSELQHSFRSSMAVLRLVDLAFSGAGSVGLGGAPEHVAFFDTLPGRVDLWPAVAPGEGAPETDWEDPVDQPGAEDAHVILARTIAAEIRAMIQQGTQIPDRGGARAVHEGDFLILVQRRSVLFQEIIRACKAAGLAVAGADRLKLGAELAVRDIASVLTFLATPEDDLALAEALRSPLFGWSEQDLYDLAQPRKGFLWEALRNAAGHEKTVFVLQDLLGETDFLRPYDLIERLLNRHGGRDRLLARLGPEAEDGIDELIAQSLSYESTEIPSLMGFLGWLGADDIEVKRQLENEGRTIRVMTVHGSKGLESPIVILPDTAKPRAPRSGELYRADNGAVLWRGGGMTPPPAMQDLQDAERTRMAEERMRLLYVALTRAEKWLIVAAAGDTGAGEDSWYALVETGLKANGTTEVAALSPQAQALGPVHRFARGDWPANADPSASQAPAPAVVLPDWVRQPAPTPVRPVAALTPSDLGGAKALPGDPDFADEEASKRYGRQMHLLLEHLPKADPQQWDAMAVELLGDGADQASADDIAAILPIARRVIDTLRQADFMGPETLAEVVITADPPELQGQRLHGTIDLLRIRGDRISVIDYKSNAIIPATNDDIPLGLVRQMAAYRAALRQIHPGATVDCALLWTRTATITPVPDAQMDMALRTIIAPT